VFGQAPAAAAPLRPGEILVGDPDFIPVRGYEDGMAILGERDPSLLRIDPLTGHRQTITSSTRGDGPSIRAITDVVVDRQGRVIILDPYAYNLLQVDVETGDRAALTDNFDPAQGPSLHAFSQMALDGGDGSVILADHLERNVYRVNLDTGQRTLLSGPARGSGPMLESLACLRVDSQGAIWATGWIEEEPLFHIGLYRIDPVTGDRRLVSGPAQQPNGFLDSEFVLVGANRAVFPGYQRVTYVDLITGEHSIVPSEGPWMTARAEAAAITPDGRLVFTGGQPGSVIEMDLAASTHSVLSGPDPAFGPGLWMPQGIAVVVPEPASAALLVSACGGVLGAARRRS
jgi:sugar lactone lactonase YvrE